jgi:hypothetical protein
VGSESFSAVLGAEPQTGIRVRNGPPSHGRTW